MAIWPQFAKFVKVSTRQRFWFYGIVRMYLASYIATLLYCWKNWKWEITLYMYVCMTIRTYVCMWACVCVCVCVSVCVCTYARTYITFIRRMLLVLIFITLWSNIWILPNTKGRWYIRIFMYQDACQVAATTHLLASNMNCLQIFILKVMLNGPRNYVLPTKLLCINQIRKCELTCLDSVYVHLSHLAMYLICK